jgi:hypothetical protein
MTANRSSQAGSPLRSGPNLEAINHAALPALVSLLRRWLPDGRVVGGEYVAINPRRFDQHPGSFKINLISDRWADFALTSVSGGDPVSLAAYLANCSQVEAAQRLANMLGISHV